MCIEYYKTRMRAQQASRVAESMLAPQQRVLSLCCASKGQHLLVALEELGFGLVQALYNALDNLPRLILKLVLGRAENLLEHADQLGRKALDGGFVGFVWWELLANFSSQYRQRMHGRTYRACTNTHTRACSPQSPL